METKTNTIASVAAAAAVVVSDQSNKENVPPVCNTTTNKGKKISIPHTSPSFKHKNKKKGSASATKRKPKRVPLADITNLFNINSDGSTLTLAQHQPQIEVSDLVSDPSISHRRTTATTPAIVPSSKKLRMGFR